MNSLIEKIYFSCPVILQNLLVSIYGYKLSRERYSDLSDRYLSELKDSQYFNKDELLKLQEEKFVRLAKHAIVSTSYYRNLANKNGFSENDIETIDDLKRFPILKKSDLRGSEEQFISDDYKKEKLIRLNTSGTTGSPLSVYCNSDIRTHHYAFFSRLRGWFGLNEKSKRATLFGRIIMLPEQNNPPFWRYDFINRNMLMSSYHLSEKNIPHYYNQLVKYNPDEIIGYPSSVYQIALYVLKSGARPLQPKVVFTTAETLLSHQREVIERAFLAPLVDQYGCTEMAFFASQCEFGTMHFHDEHGITEVRDEETNALVPEGKGSIVVTGLLNYVMPLIRYEIGDLGTIGRESCECGRPFSILSSIEGRVDDIIYSSNGTPVGRLDPIFKGGIGVDEAQIIQREDGSIDISVVPNDKFTDENKKWLENQIRTRVGDGIDISIYELGSLKKDKNGKFKSVISYYSPEL